MSLNTIVDAPARRITPRGPLSEALVEYLSGGLTTRDVDLAAAARDAIEVSASPWRDDDIQLTLFALYAISYGSLDEFGPEWEWDTRLITLRVSLEEAFERELRDLVPLPDSPEPTVDAVARSLFALTSEDTKPGLSHYFAKQATREQAEEFLKLRSMYTLREADPHSWAIPRLTGRAKAALVEIQADEYGGGKPDRVHATIFAHTLEAAGLDSTYGAYLDVAPAVTLASLNTMSMFGLNRRLLGAIVGHLAAFEMTSSIPSRLYADGLHRLGYSDVVTDYYDEHVEADAVHEQIAGRDLAGALAEDHPKLLPDILFGAAACLTVDGAVSTHILEAWKSGESALRGSRVAKSRVVGALQ